MSATRGWKLVAVRQDHAPNFGGEEWWWEAEYQNESGEKRKGLGHTREQAIENGLENIAYDWTKPVTLTTGDNNED